MSVGIGLEVEVRVVDYPIGETVSGCRVKEHLFAVRVPYLGGTIRSREKIRDPISLPLIVPLPFVLLWGEKKPAARSRKRHQRQRHQR
jgi:hypothetical protein